VSEQPDTRDVETDFDPDRVVVRDKRRIDPTTGAAREAAAAASAGAADAAGEPVVEAGPDPVAELTADLQRLSAEYANYRKRVERDRVAVVEMATVGVLSELLPLLDDVDRARAHGDLTGGFKGVGEALEALTTRLGLERYGASGEPFDPQVHEAVMQAEPDDTASVAVCAQVLQPGFRVGARVLRPARVSVAEPGLAADAPGAVPGATAEE